MYNLIISCATFKQRLIEELYIDTFNSINSFTKELSVKYVLNISKKDKHYITDNLRELLLHNNIELILCDIDLKCHNKYYYSMNKYKDVPIITIDDDILYTKDYIFDLYNFYKINQDCVVCNCSKDIEQDKKYIDWKKTDRELTTDKVLPIGCGGVLYPPNILRIENLDINDIYMFEYNDDFLLKRLEMNYNIKIHTFGKEYPRQNKKVVNTPQLYYKNMYNRNDEYSKNIRF